MANELMPSDSVIADYPMLWQTVKKTRPSESFGELVLQIETALRELSRLRTAGPGGRDDA